MHINDVESILKETFCGQKGNQYEIKKYNDGICCQSDFVLLFEGREYAYIKFDETGKMSRKAMGVQEDKMGASQFYIVVRDTDDFIPISLSCTVYPKNDRGSSFTCDTSEILDRLKSYRNSSLKSLSLDALCGFFEKTYSSLIRGRMGSFISMLKNVGSMNDAIEDHGTYFMLTPKYENMFFYMLLGGAPSGPKRMCRYTSLSSLFRTLSERKQSMCSIACMNDKSEIDYALSFIRDNTPNSNVIQRLSARTDGWESITQSYILFGSRMGKKDDLNMWRLYADDSKGVCLWYDVNEPLPDNFFLAKVCYAKNGTHAELAYLASKLGKSVCGRSFELHNLNSWLHFFKPSEYSVEEEVRLLYAMSDMQEFETCAGKWILNDTNGVISSVVSFPIEKTSSRFPLKLSHIVLGPNLRERNVNKTQLQAMIEQGQIGVSDSFEITDSCIDTYRV